VTSLVLGNATCASTRSVRPFDLVHLMLNSLYTISLLGEGPPIDDGYIEPSKPMEEIRSEPYSLLKDFEWTILDISDSKQVYFLSIISILFHDHFISVQRGL